LRCRFTPVGLAVSGPATQRPADRGQTIGDPAAARARRLHMKPDIHPAYVVTKVTCTCGNSFVTRSTAPGGEIHADICSSCHPFYTGKQKILDTGGRVARFERRYAKKDSGDKKDASK
jgi:large subunit ribosomal protein L31